MDLECTKFPEGNWHECCIEHDYDYYHQNGKWKSDVKLLWCVLKKGHPIIAPLMWLGVTLGGWGPYLGHRKRNREGGSSG